MSLGCGSRVPERDSRSPKRDTESPIRDSGSPIRESGSPIRESGSLIRDSVSPIRDSVSPKRDPEKRQSGASNTSPGTGRRWVEPTRATKPAARGDIQIKNVKTEACADQVGQITLVVTLARFRWSWGPTDRFLSRWAFPSRRGGDAGFRCRQEGRWRRWDPVQGRCVRVAAE